MRNALRTFALAAATLAAALLPAQPASANVAVGVRFGLPGPHVAAPHLPVPHVAVRHNARGHVWVDGRWVRPPFPGAVWVTGYYNRWGRWVPGCWVGGSRGYNHRDRGYGYRGDRGRRDRGHGYPRRW
jgi:hypothetical protein